MQGHPCRLSVLRKAKIRTAAQRRATPRSTGTPSGATWHPPLDLGAPEVPPAAEPPLGEPASGRLIGPPELAPETHIPPTHLNPSTPHSWRSVPLSATPSQSSSNALQVSALGEPGVHCLVQPIA